MITNKQIIANFKQLYSELNRDSLNHELLASVYHENILFEDCFHRIQALPNLLSYFDNLYENVSYINFSFEDEWDNEQSAVLSWTMSYQHPKLNSGEMIYVQGVSHLSFDHGLVIHHKDYFDAGALLYEHVPLLKRIIQFLKNRIA